MYYLVFFNRFFAILNFFTFGDLIISFMTNADEVLNISKDLKIWIIIVPICSFPAYILDGIFFGTTHTAEIRKAMIFSTIFYFLTALILTSKFQNDGLWLTLNLFLIMRALTLIYYYPNIERSVSSIKN